ncbi:hypothetical protein ACOSP7_018808 [Xanthoceras sorbifolium]
MNKIMKHILKTKLKAKKGAWAYELPKVLWAYKTTTRSIIGETQFSMVYGTKAMIPVEVIVSTHKRATFNPE